MDTIIGIGILAIVVATATYDEDRLREARLLKDDQEIYQVKIELDPVNGLHKIYYVRPKTGNTK